MNNYFIWLIIGIACVVFGILDHISAMNEKGKIRSILDVWRHTVNYMITAILGYFLVVIRWPLITQNADLSISDFVVGLAFLIGVFGWWPYVIKNFTEGIDTIISKIK
jgi:hypothetical protein